MENMRSMIELKPCPFCGKSPDLSDPDTLHPSGTAWKPHGNIRVYCSFRNIPQEQWCWQINCPPHMDGCGAELHADSRQEVIDRWNRRALPE